MNNKSIFSLHKKRRKDFMPLRLSVFMTYINDYFTINFSTMRLLAS